MKIFEAKFLKDNESAATIVKIYAPVSVWGQNFPGIV